MDSYFIIYGIFCKVLEGLGTEVPWNPFLQLFSCDIMKKLGVKTAPAYKPVFYHQYMDNTFLTLKSYTQDYSSATQTASTPSSRFLQNNIHIIYNIMINTKCISRPSLHLSILF